MVDLRALVIDYLLLNNTSDADRGILTADTVHMNNAGNQLLADAFEDALLSESPVPEIGSVTMSLSGSHAVFNWDVSSVVTYTLQSRTNLLEGSWSNWVENISGPDGLMSFTNSTNGSVSYYRIMGK